MKVYSSRELINILRKDGWYFVKCVGDHYHFKHPVKTGKVTIPHPKKNLTIKLVKTILKQSQISK